MSTIKVDQLADEVMKQLNDFADATCDDMKAAVKKAGNTVRDQIKSTAPNRTGAYAKSWSVKNTKESSHAFEVTIYSRNRYQLAHLLEFGHAKRGGGRVSGRAHIAPAEQAGIEVRPGFPLPTITSQRENRPIRPLSVSCSRRVTTSPLTGRCTSKYPKSI